MTSSGPSNLFIKHMPSALSILRGVMALFIPFFFISNSPTIHIVGGVLFFIAAITDYYDGWWARKFNCISDLGKILDPSMDKILVLTPFAIFAYMGYYSVWWIVPIFIREILITFFRVGWWMNGTAAGAEKLGKIKFCVQTAAVSFAYFYMLSGDFKSWESAAQVLKAGMHFFVIVASLLTIVSGITFAKSNAKLFDDQNFAKFVSAMGVGLLPKAPGTWGSALTVLLFLLVFWNAWLFWGLFFLCFFAGFWAISKIDLSKSKDPGFVVLDEACGILVTYLFVPVTPLSVIAGFFLFRLFDIVKLFPCKRLERFPRFWGILMDDIGAGIYACLCLHLLVRYVF